MLATEQPTGVSNLRIKNQDNSTDDCHWYFIRSESNDNADGGNFEGNGENFEEKEIPARHEA